ncbi:hypothetical protein [Clostridium sp. DMHC 10]|nr:hypothetical protein [Clostridium sp. DMHC 10]
MSDKLVFVAMFCITALIIAGMFFYSTYKKEKIRIKEQSKH